jgi:undecaprenyl-diphosphatase
MMASLDHIDRSLFYFLNGMHSASWDAIMLWGTRTIIWIPLFAWFLYLVIRKYRWQTFVILLFAAVTILISDQVSNFVKDHVQRLRPSNDPTMVGVHIINGYKGGMYGFYSGHATNTFSLALFLIVLLGKEYRFFFIPVLLWAAFMSYTRIYLGLHYPGDILAGIVAGTVIGYFMGRLCLDSLDIGSRFRKKT